MEPIAWVGGHLRLLDQTRLPWEEVYLTLATPEEVAEAISSLRARGAPLIGVAAAYGLALAARRCEAGGHDLLAIVQEAAQMLLRTRPTARNLAWALERMLAVARSAQDIRQALLEEARRIHDEQREADRRLSLHGAGLIPQGAGVLTHCNTGALATGGYGTALGVIRAAWEQGKRFPVYITETRPLLQGARLTAWELKQAGIPATLIADSAAGHFVARGRVACVIVGADRIARNGDVANKIGTYMLALAAWDNSIPFYVAAPTNTIDLSIASGDAIPIEERPPEEVTTIGGRRMAPEAVAAANPAFDVTPGRCVTAIITERGIVCGPDYTSTIQELLLEEARPCPT